MGAPLQLLRCERAGRLYGVPVDEIESIERQRPTPIRTFLVPRGGGVPVEVDRVGNVTEVDEASVLMPPARLGTACPGLVGLVELDGSTLPLIRLSLLASLPAESTGASALAAALPALPLRPPERGPAPTAPPRPSLHLLAFRLALDGAEFHMPLFIATPVGQVLEVTEPCPWVPLETDGRWLRGLLSWRGQAAAVVDLAAGLGLRRHDTAVERLLIVRGTATPTPLALPVPTTLQRITGEGTWQIDPADAGLDHHAVRGVWRTRDRLVVIPDYDAMT